jgi:membrane fusion protein, copper/silver efflux system
MEMRHRAPLVLLLLATFLGGYGYGRWYARDPSVVSAKAVRRILYYHCPMHPAYRSDKPGTAPCCHMALEPVYAEEGSEAADATVTGALHLTPQQQQLVGVEYATAEYAPAFGSIRGAARVGVNEKRVARIETKLEGWIDRLYVSAAGERVTQGQILFTVYNRKSVPTQLEFLRAMDMRMAATMAGNSAPPSQMADAEALLSAAKQRMDAQGFSDAQMEAIGRSHQPLWKVPVLAPIGGTVIEYHAAQGQMLTPGTILTIADLSTVWVTAELAAVDAAAIRPGQAATLRAPFLPGRTFRGKVDTILPQLDAATRRLEVRLQFDNPDQLLRPEMYGEIELSTGAGRRALTVPGEAVVDSGRSQTVFLDLGDGYVQPREVTTGERFGDRVEIVRGLKPGERIVTSGNFLLDSESRMRLGH